MTKLYTIRQYTILEFELITNELFYGNCVYEYYIRNNQDKHDTFKFSFSVGEPFTEEKLKELIEAGYFENSLEEIIPCDELIAIVNNKDQSEEALKALVDFYLSYDPYEIMDTIGPLDSPETEDAVRQAIIYVMDNNPARIIKDLNGED